MPGQKGESRPGDAITRWSLVMIVFGAGVVQACQIGKAPPVLPMLGQELGLSLVMMGWVISSFNVLGIFIAIPAGAISDSLGPRRMFLTALGMAAVGSLLGSFAQGAALLIASRILEGLGYLMSAVSGPGLLLKFVLPRDRRMAFGIWASYMPAGGALMMALASMLAAWLGWRGLWRMNTAVLVLYFFWFAWATRHVPESAPSDRSRLLDLHRDVWQVVRAPGPLILALSFCFYAFQFMTVVGFLPTLLIREQGVSPGWAAFMTAMIMVINALGNWMGGRLMQAGWRRWVLVTLAFIATGFCCYGIYWSALPLAARYVFGLLYGAASGVVPAALIDGTTIAAPRPSLVGTTNGLMVQIALFGSLFGPPATAALATRTGGWESVGLLLMVFSGIGVILSLRFRRVENRLAGYP